MRKSFANFDFTRNIGYFVEWVRNNQRSLAFNWICWTICVIRSIGLLWMKLVCNCHNWNKRLAISLNQIVWSTRYFRNNEWWCAFSWTSFPLAFIANLASLSSSELRFMLEMPLNHMIMLAAFQVLLFFSICVYSAECLLSILSCWTLVNLSKTEGNPVEIHPEANNCMHLK